jgi:hypothetical protein
MRAIVLALGIGALFLAVQGVQAGRIGGPGKTVTKVNANSTDKFDVKFEGGKLARVEVKGDGDTDLDLYVYDESGNVVVKDDDDTDHCIVTWTPSSSTKYTIRVVNRGRVYNQYTITTNLAKVMHNRGGGPGTPARPRRRFQRSPRSASASRS